MVGTNIAQIVFNLSTYAIVTQYFYFAFPKESLTWPVIFPPVGANNLQALFFKHSLA